MTQQTMRRHEEGTQSPSVWLQICDDGSVQHLDTQRTFCKHDTRGAHIVFSIIQSCYAKGTFGVEVALEKVFGERTGDV